MTWATVVNDERMPYAWSVFFWTRARPDFTRLGGALPRFFSRCLLPFCAHVPTSAGLFASTALFVDGLPGSLFRSVLGDSPVFVAFLDVLRLALLLGGVFGFRSFGHDLIEANSMPNAESCR